MRHRGALTLAAAGLTTCFWMVHVQMNNPESGPERQLEVFLLFYFGHVVDSNLVATWGPPDKTQHIFEAEVLPYALALTVWGATVKGCCIFAFIDNEAAKASWITGSATSDAALRILHNGTRLEADLDVWPFFSRVPTHSNMGDDPSRGRFEMLERLGAQRTLISDAQVLRLMADMDTSRTHE